MKTRFATFSVLLTLVLSACTAVTPDPEPTETPDNTQTPTSGKEMAREVARTGEASDLVMVTSPQANFAISSPVTVTGEAPGYWFFEATAPVDIVNWDGMIIGQGYVTAQNWMTEDIVPFSGTVEFTYDEDNSYINSGWLILRRDNASGLPENDAAVEIPVILSE